MQQAISFIWQISLYAAVLGFWPAMYLIFNVWSHLKNDEVVPKRVREWFPVIVYPWIGSVGVFLAIFIYVVFLASRR